MARMNRRHRLISNEWKELIADARTVFSGRMTYAANFDEYFDVSWWRYLDMVGINAYFPLREVKLYPVVGWFTVLGTEAAGRTSSH